MSRAFTREENNENAFPDVGERPLSAHRNLVTRQGLAQIDANIARLRTEIAEAAGSDDRHHLAMLDRDLRYWLARRENAEFVQPEAGDIVRFGMTVAIEDENGNARHWTIVGEDEADPKTGTISHVSPMAVALFGKAVGDAVVVNGTEWEILTLEGGMD